MSKRDESEKANYLERNKFLWRNKPESKLKMELCWKANYQKCAEIAKTRV